MLSASQAFGTARGVPPGGVKRPDARFPGGRESVPVRRNPPRPEYPTGGMRRNPERKALSEERLQSGAEAQTSGRGPSDGKAGGGDVSSAHVIEQWQAVRNQEGGGPEPGVSGGGIEEDNQKLRFMEGYIKNSSSIMQQRMRNWESENQEKLQGGEGRGGGGESEGGFGAANGGLEAQAGIPVYSVPLPDRRPGSRSSSPPPADPQVSHALR